MRLSKKQEAGIEAACEILSEIAKWGLEEEEERLTLAFDTLYDMLEKSRDQKAKERSEHKSNKSKGR